ncbi:aldehyde dehydrogenase [Actinomadura gamaensis]|uniref:Aldehyde dehydrogenase n=1 Tax=Actinomadura gamaensis TaxID=1763541 RepID=A0ABV9TQ27_9ACTN
MPDSTLYIDGEWTAAHASATIPVIEAATGDPLGAVTEAGAEDVDRAVAAAVRARRGWAATDPAERAAVLERFADGIEKRGERLAELVSRQNGTPLVVSVQGSVQAPAGLLRYYAALARAGFADERRAGLAFEGTVRLQREPVGVVGAIVPWNFPVTLAVHKLAPALAAGCAVVLKPAPETSLDTSLLVEAAAEAGLPAGVLNVVTGGSATGRALVAHPDVAKIAFTGSTAVGREIGAECGRALKPVTLELGGKSAAIVLPDADLAAVLPGLAFLSFVNSGQSCFLNSRVLAPRARYDEIVEGLAGVARSFAIGDPLDPSTTMGPLVSERQRARVEEYVAAGRAEGARVVTGGGRPDGFDRGWYVEPTVFADASNSMRVAREEIFGPVVCVLPYDTEDEAVAIANDSDYGLAGSVWSADPEHALAVASRVETGTIGVNMWTPDPGSPFGGWKSSGLGSELGPEGLASYQRIRSVYVPS